MLWKKTTVMLIAFAVLTVAAIGVSAIQGGGKGPQLDIPALEKDRIVRIEVSNIEKPVTLEKTGDGWKIQPAGHKADEAAVDSALSTLSGLFASTLVSKSASNHEKYGVGDDSMILTVSDSDNQSWKLIVGNESADKRGEYVRVPGDKQVFIAGKRIKSMFEKEPNRWRDRVVAKFEADKTTGLFLSSKGQTLAFARTEGGQWQLGPAPENMPADFKLDSAKVDQVVRTLSNLRASDFADNVASLKEIGLDPPVATVKVERSDGDPVVLQLGNDKDKLTIAARQDSEQVYLLSEYSVKKLIQTLEDFRDLHVAPFELEQARKVRIEQDGKKLVFAKDKDWTLVENSDQLPADFRLDPKKVESLVRSASTFQGKSLVGAGAPASAGFNKPLGVLHVTLEDGTSKEIVVGGNAGDKDVYVKGDGQAVFIAAKFGAERLLQGLDKFKVTAQKQQPMISPDALKNLPPEVAQQLMQKQKQEIMQKQIINQMMKKQETGKQ